MHTSATEAFTHIGLTARPQQLEIISALHSGGQMSIQAPTGTGKSLALLIGAILNAALLGKRTAISTYSVLLTDQYINHDIETVRPIAEAHKVSIVGLKGASNYLCLTKAEKKLGTANLPASVSNSIAHYLGTATSGHNSKADWFTFISKLAEDHPRLSKELKVFRDILTASSACMASCEPQDCAYKRYREQAKDADVVVTTHAMVKANQTYNSSVLGQFDAYVYDEAHKMLSSYADKSSFSVVPFYTKFKDNLIIKNFLRQFDVSYQDVQSYVGGLYGDSSRDLRMLNRYLHTGKVTTWDSDFQGHLTPSGTDDPTFTQLRDFFDLLTKDTHKLADRILTKYLVKKTTTAQDIAEFKEFYNVSEEPGAQGILQRMADWSRRICEWKRMADEGKYNSLAVWSTATVLKKDEVVRISKLNSELVDLTGVWEKYLSPGDPDVVLISGTVGSATHPTFIADQLGMSDVEFLEVSSPFDYSTQQNMVCLDAFPDIRNYLSHYPSGVLTANLRGSRDAQLFESLQGITGGTIVYVNTHYEKERLYTVLQKLRDQLEDSRKFPLFAQSSASTKSINRAVLEEFKNTPGAVLIGLHSFREGIDIPGSSLEVIYFYDSPELFSTPANTQRMRNYSSREGQSFGQDYERPVLAMEIQQMYGRLIRTSEDHGWVVIPQDRKLTARKTEAHEDACHSFGLDMPEAEECNYVF